VPFFIWVKKFTFVIHYFTTLKKLQKPNKMNELISFGNAAKMYSISESTLRRKLKKLDKNDMNNLTKYVNGKVFIVVKNLSLYENIDNIKIVPFSQKVNTKDKTETENLWKQNEILLNSLTEKDIEIRNLSSIVMKLQNDVNGYIKQIGEGKKEGEPITDIILKIALVIVMVLLLLYIFIS